MTETWAPIKNYEGLYEISNKGQIKNSKTGKQIAPFGKGYQMVALYKNKRKKYIYVHRLVALTFITNEKNLPQVNHINGIKNDNSVENLEWCTAKYNIQESFKLGLSKNGSGKESVRSRAIQQFDLEGNLIKEWESINIAKTTLKISHIHECCKGNRKTAGGYIWKYKMEG